MKTINTLLTALLLFSASYIISCTGDKKSDESALSGRFRMKVIERKIDKTASVSDSEEDTTFNSLFRGMIYIPDNSVWNFADESILILSKTDNVDYEPDTVVYKVSRRGDILFILSGDFAEKFSLRKIDNNRFELDFGDPSFQYMLIREP